MGGGAPTRRDRVRGGGHPELQGAAAYSRQEGGSGRGKHGAPVDVCPLRNRLRVHTGCSGRGLDVDGKSSPIRAW